MKLRNKKTGEIRDGRVEVIFQDNDKFPNPLERHRVDSLAELNENWEDYKPAEPLIKDEKICKAVRAWAEMHNIKKVFYCEYSWKNNIAWVEDAGDDESMINGESLCIDIPIIGVKNREYYTIAELCGEEEE